MVLYAWKDILFRILFHLGMGEQHTSPQFRAVGNSFKYEYKSIIFIDRQEGLRKCASGINFFLIKYEIVMKF